MRYHIDPHSLEITQCTDESCSKIPMNAHYHSLAEAREAVRFSQALEELIHQPCEVNFNREFSSKSNSYFLEASLKTPFDDDVHFTIESFEDHAVGSMLLAGKEYILARANCCRCDEDFERLAKETVNEARKRHRVDIWPDKSVIDLYRAFSRNSNAEEIKSPLLRLEMLETPGLTQLYKGETAKGAELFLRAAYGYAVAEIDQGEGSHIVYESGLTNSIFANEQERNAFAARAFGELLKMGEI